jgi:predicted dehydrogenase
MKKMSKLKVGIAGYGVVGKRRRQCVEAHPDTVLVAICDQHFQGNGTMDDGINYYQDYSSMLNENLDILFVCLTNDIAPKASIDGLNAGLHVFCEKPPGKSLEDISSVIRVEKKYTKLKLMYGFNHRYHESVIEALKIVKSKELGKIINLRGVYGKSKLITFDQSDWRTKREVAGGGVLLDQGIHMVDLMRLFAGEFNDVHSFISNNHWGYDVEDNAYAIMRTESGIVAMLNSSATQWKHLFNLEISFEKGSLTLGGILSGSKSYGEETLKVVYADPNNDMGKPRETASKYNKDSSWYKEISEFIDCIIKNKTISSGTSSDALESMRIVYSIYYADQKWRQTYEIPDPNKYKN